MTDQSYPPTHHYNWRLKPQGPLKERQEIIDSEFSWFFEGSRFLDVACNKGYFSLTNQKNFDYIVGLDTNKEAIDQCNKLNKYAHTNFVVSSFREFTSPVGFDKIFIGNAAHHLFMDTQDWSWIAKLHALSDGTVLIEGAQSTDCKDMTEYIPQKLHGVFNRFQMEMSRYFTLEKVYPTTSYTPDRYFMFYRKRTLRHYKLRDLEVKKVLSVNDFKVFETKDNLIAKVFIRNPKALQIWNGFIRTRLACNSPVTNGAAGEIYVNDNPLGMLGWVEEKLEGRTYEYFENEKVLWNKICDHNIFLAKNGYTDLDTATINFNKKTDLLFDKSLVFPINKLKEESIDTLPLLFNQSYKMRGPFIDNIVAALKSFDSKKVEEVYRMAKQ